jgi:hypothetical protein
MVYQQELLEHLPWLAALIRSLGGEASVNRLAIGNIFSCEEVFDTVVVNLHYLSMYGRPAHAAWMARSMPL